MGSDVTSRNAAGPQGAARRSSAAALGFPPSSASASARLGNTGTQRAVQARLQSNDESVLRLRSTGEVLTEARLVEWAVRQNLPARKLIRQVMSSNLFSGNDEARENGAMALVLAFREMPLAERREQRQEARLMEKEAARQEAAGGKSRKKKARALATETHDRNLADATTALRNAGPEAELREIYEGLQTLDESLFESMARDPHTLPMFRPLRQFTLENRLQQHGLDEAGLEALAAQFETRFRESTLDIAFRALDVMEEMCRDSLNQPGQLEALARSMFGSLAPVRVTSVALLNHADRLNTGAALVGSTEGVPPSRYAEERARASAMKKEADSSRQFALGLSESQLDQVSLARLPMFPVEAITRAGGVEEVRQVLRSFLDQYLADIALTRESLLEDPRRIYKLETLLDVAKSRLGVAKGSLGDRIVQSQVEDASKLHWMGKLQWVLLFALFAASMAAPGGLLVTAGTWAATGVGIHDAWKAIQDYQEGGASYRIGMVPIDPSFMWVLFPLLAAGLALEAALKLLGESADFQRALARFLRRRDVAQLEADLQKVPELTQDMRNAIVSEARRRRVSSDVPEEAAQAEIDAAERAVADAAEPMIPEARSDFPDAPTKTGPPWVDEPVSNDLPPVSGEIPWRDLPDPPLAVDPAVAVLPEGVDDLFTQLLRQLEDAIDRRDRYEALIKWADDLMDKGDAALSKWYAREDAERFRRARARQENAFTEAARIRAKNTAAKRLKDLLDGDPKLNPPVNIPEPPPKPSSPFKDFFKPRRRS